VTVRGQPAGNHQYERQQSRQYQTGPASLNRIEERRAGKLTEGVVKDILTRSHAHPHCIKVRLESGQVGRVKEIAVPKVRRKAQNTIKGDTS
jgi:uncharacterized repeat protein (TIGR03833 family)